MVKIYPPLTQIVVQKSKSGYTGPGEIVDHAYANSYLVKTPDGKLIIVKFQDLKHASINNRKK